MSLKYAHRGKVMKKNQLIAAVTAGLVLTSTASSIINSQIQMETVYAATSPTKKLVSDISALEVSYSKNSKTIGNAEFWAVQIASIKVKIESIKNGISKEEYNGFLLRINNIDKGVRAIKDTYTNGFNKAEKLIKEGEAISSRDKKVALDKLKQGKEIALNLQRHSSRTALIIRANKEIKLIDPGALNTITVATEKEAKDLKGSYDVITIQPKNDNESIEITGVEAFEVNLYYDGFVKFTNSNIVDLINNKRFNGSILYIENTKIDNIYASNSLVLSDISFSKEGRKNAPICVNNIFADTSGVDKSEASPYILIEGGVGNFYVNSAMGLSLEGHVKNLSIKGQGTYGDINGLVDNLIIQKGATDVVIGGTGGIEKATVMEGGTIIRGPKIPSNTPNVDSDEARANVKMAMKYVGDRELGLYTEDSIKEYKEYLQMISAKGVNISVVPLENNEDTYKVTVGYGKYSESKKVKITVIKPDASLNKKGEMNNNEASFVWKSKNGVGTVPMAGDNSSSENDYNGDGGYLAIQLIDGSGKAIKLGDVLETISINRNEDSLDLIPDDNREKSDFGLSGFEDQGTKLSQPEGGNAIFYGVKLKGNNTYTMAFYSGEVQDILLGIKPKLGVTPDDYTLRITPAHQGELGKFIKLGDAIEYKFTVK